MPGASSTRGHGSTRLAAALTLVAWALLFACADDDATDAAIEVRPFREVQATDFVFEPDPMDPSRGIFRVETTEPMICAIVWGETEALGRLNNSQSMNGTGIIAHDVLLPDVEPGRPYHFVVQGTTADGTLHRSEPGTFAIPVVDDAAGEESSGVAVGANLAVGSAVAVSSQHSDGFAGDLAVDDDLGTEWSTAGDGDEGWLTVDLGSVHRVAAVEFVTRSMLDGSATTSTFTVSVDGGAPVGPFAAATPAANRPVALDATGRELRFDVHRSSGGNVGAVEVRVFAPP